MLAYQPGFLGYPDSGTFYVYSAGHSLFHDRWHVVGYATFLRLLHAIDASVAFAVVIQHLLGIVTAILLYLALRRITPAWLALVAAAVVLLGGDQTFLEHAVLSEAAFTPLLAGSLYAVVRSVEGEGWRWPAMAGVLAALSGTVRVSAVALVPVLAVWLLAVPASRRRIKALRAVTLASTGAVIVFAYLVVVHANTGEWSLTPNGPFNSYARAATFADCRKFEPPAGTAWLCDRTPLDKREESRWYLFSGGPLVRRYGRPFRVPRSVLPELSRFARAAAFHQPIDWWRAAATDFRSYIDQRPSRPERTAAGYLTVLTWPQRTRAAMPYVTAYYGPTRVTQRHGLLDRLRDYAGVTRIAGKRMATLLLLALLAPLACRGRVRLGALLFAAVAFTVMAVPVLTLGYDARYGVPAYGPLVAAAAMGGYGIVTRLMELRGRATA